MALYASVQSFSTSLDSASSRKPPDTSGVGDERAEEGLGHELGRDQVVGRGLLHRGLVADVLEVLLRVRRIEQEVDQRVGEDRPLGPGRDHEEVVGHRGAGRLPVAEHVGVGALGQVLERGDHVARPGLVDVRGALGDLLVGEDVEAGVGGLDERLHVGLGGIDDLRVAGVGVGDAAVVHAERQRLALVVDDADEALVRRVPQQLPAVVAGEGRVVDDVAAVGDTGRVDGVGHRVLGADVVVRALQALQHVGEVGQVLLVERLDQLAGDVAGQPERGRADHEVDLERVVAQVREQLVLGVVGGDLHLRAERRLEGRHRVGVDVVGVVEDLERPRLRLLATGHGLDPVGRAA